MNCKLKGLLAVLGLVFANQVFATVCAPGDGPNNCEPPTGAILDLNGTPIVGSYTNFTVSFVATDTTTNISFAFREDPAFIFLDDVSVTTGLGPNLLVNGGFEDGPVGANAPSGWTYLNSFGASFAGVVNNNGPRSGSNNYYDGAVQAYDGISQAIATDIGTVYDISFWMFDNSGGDIFRRVSTNGQPGISGNGIDLLVYAGAIPTLVPEPGSLALLGLALAGFGAARRRKS